MVKRVNKTAIVNGEGKNFLKKISIALVIFMMDIFKLKYKEKLNIFFPFLKRLFLLIFEPLSYEEKKIKNKIATSIL